MNYNNSIVEPGDMVGILGAQTLGEPATQMTISAFHNVGSSAGTEGVPRLHEIYGSSPNMKSPMMTIFFDDKYNKNEKYLTKDNNPPNFSVEFFKEQKNINNINCFSDEANEWKKSDLNFNKNILSIKFREKFTFRRGNCL